ncbi:FapA family protein [Halalkalibacterium ligniniphilum]|uniref:FapA family protein n=1 Tax=Halalkalibacterium ligniniphilum TaxID=1134413 RepID=UPI00034B5936|nr:FapA family protein [Halalkalibacterium ligniniphilum]
MGNSIVSKGKTVTEAVEIALELLNASKDEIDIEVIDYGKNMVFGMITKPAIVKVTKRKDTPYNEQRRIIEETEFFQNLTFDSKLQDNPEDIKNTEFTIQKEEESIQGKAWVEDGKIYCKDSERSVPLVTIPDDIRFFRNEQQEYGTVVLQEGDIIRTELEKTITETVWKIELHERDTVAKLFIRPGCIITRTISDQEPTRHLKLTVEEKTEVNQTITKDEILAKMNELGIVYGIDYIEIERACFAEEEGTYEIAKGLKPTEGKHGRFEPRINVSGKKNQPKERTDGSIDFREIHQIPIVEEGYVIGDIIPPIPGNHGINVKGEPIMPEPSLPVILRLGKGVTFFEENSTVVAIKSGRPQIDKQGQMVRIAVMPKLVHSGDVDISSGNIHFIGDVEITGSVQESMTVDAEGDITINENVNSAKISSGHSIYVRNNVISSKITAGKSNLLISELVQLLAEIRSQLKNIILAIEQLYQTTSFKKSDFQVMGLSSLLRLLMEQKYKPFLPLIHQFIQKIDEGNELLDQEWESVREFCHKAFAMVHPEQVRDIEDLRRFSNRLDNLYNISIVPPESNAHITLNYALNSQIYSSGDINMEEGCYNSNVHSEGTVNVKGYVLGGTIYAGKGANISEVGSKAGARTKIVVPDSQKIVIGVAMENTLIQIGRKSHLFSKETSNVCALISSKNGEILIHS